MPTTAVTGCIEWRCSRLATGEDGRCGPHRAGQKRRIENDAKRRAESDAIMARHHREQAQRVYADRWRREHPDQHYSPERQCPLCGKMVQSTADQLGDGPFDAYGPARGVYEAHTSEHGIAWDEYQAAGRA